MVEGLLGLWETSAQLVCMCGDDDESVLTQHIPLNSKLHKCHCTTSLFLFSKYSWHTFIRSEETFRNWLKHVKSGEERERSGIHHECYGILRHVSRSCCDPVPAAPGCEADIKFQNSHSVHECVCESKCLLRLRGMLNRSRQAVEGESAGWKCCV